MVTVIDYVERQKEDGSTFLALILQGGVELVKSQNSGKYYATAKKASIPSTFNEETCKALIGSQISGQIKKVACDPYDYTVQETGEVFTLDFRYEFVQEETTLTSEFQSMFEPQKSKQLEEVY